MKYYLAIKLAQVLIFLVPVILNVPKPFSTIQIILLELFMYLATSAGDDLDHPDRREPDLARIEQLVILIKSSTRAILLKGRC